MSRPRKIHRVAGLRGFFLPTLVKFEKQIDRYRNDVVIDPAPLLYAAVEPERLGSMVQGDLHRDFCRLFGKYPEECARLLLALRKEWKATETVAAKACHRFFRMHTGDEQSLSDKQLSVMIENEPWVRIRISEGDVKIARHAMRKFDAAWHAKVKRLLEVERAKVKKA